MVRHFIACVLGFVVLAFGLPAAAQVSDDVVKIGVLNDQSSIFADLSGPGSVVAARLAVEDFGGTVLGKKIEIVAADHQNKPDVGLAVASRWFDAEQVDMIVDVPVSSIALAVQELARQKKRVVMFSSAGTSDLTGKACSTSGFHWTFASVAT